MTHSNPFAQPYALHCWQLRCTTITPNLLDELQEHQAVTAVSQPLLHQPDILHYYCDASYAEQAMRDHIAYAAMVCGVSIVIEHIADVVMQDWVAQTQANFPKMRVGRFHIIGSHHTAQHRNNTLVLDAGAAFGTGEHATTTGCLQAIDLLLKQRRFHNVLDMGCGTAILGMAMACATPATVLAVDNDAVAVRVAEENIAKNQLSLQMKALCSEGFKDARIAEAGAYDMIIANILARPVRAMAGDIAKVTARDAAIILSGFYMRDVAFVMSRYRQYGMKLCRIIENNGWAALILHSM
jgi:ribosomal protein L11 methyltransferase